MAIPRSVWGWCCSKARGSAPLQCPTGGGRPPHQRRFMVAHDIRTVGIGTGAPFVANLVTTSKALSY